MKKFIRAGVFVLAMAAAVGAPGRIQTELSSEWKNWLSEDVGDIITPKEKEIFLSLASERERLAFREAFWRQRDPTPGTPANERRDEHFRRLRYADEYFGRGSIKRGRETDRGRMYILLGAPADRQRFFETSANLVPCELWQYQGDSSLGLPPVFYLLFYQDPASGDHKMYSPSFDGPQRLLLETMQGGIDRSEAVERIRGVSAELAGASLSLIPGTEGGLFSANSLSSDLLIANILSLPQKQYRSAWADAFARTKDLVTTEYTASFVDSRSVAFVHQDQGRNYLHLLLEPVRMSFESHEDRVFTSLKLHVKIADLRDRTIHQEEKSISLDMSRRDFQKTAGIPVAVGDLIPLIEGSFKIDLLLQNTNTKEFSSQELAVESPAPGRPVLSPILFLSEEETVPAADRTQAFLFGNHQLVPNPRNLYAQADQAVLYWEIYHPTPDLDGGRLDFTVSRNGQTVLKETEAFQNQTPFLKRIPLAAFSPNDYECSVSLKDRTGREVSLKNGRFSISPLAAVPKPWRLNKIYPPLEHSYFSVIRAYQALGLGDHDRVIREMTQFYDPLDPNREIAKLLAWAYSAKGEQAMVLEVLGPFKDVQDVAFQELRGKAYFALKDYRRAIDAFRIALAAGGEIVEVINYLGYSFYGTGDTREALRYFERSVSLNPQQPNIRAIVEKIKQDGRDDPSPGFFNRPGRPGSEIAGHGPPFKGPIPIFGGRT